MKGIRLVTRADDAGLSATANKAIRAAVRQGIVRNISLMAPGPSIEHAAKSLGDLRGQTDFGLHVCLTSEWQNPRWGPVLEPDVVPSIIRDDGSFPEDLEELASLGPDIDQLMAEVQAQYQSLKNLGFELAYLDEHMGVGQIEEFGDRLADFADKAGLVCHRSLLADHKLALLSEWEGPQEHPGTELSDHLAGAAAGTYLLVGHPGFKTEQMERLRKPGQKAGEIMMQRNRERRMFSDIEIVDYCEYGEIELLRYSQLG